MRFIGLGSVALFLVACSGDPPAEPALHVTGALDARTHVVANAQAIALASDGRAFAANLTPSGRFALDLPVGHVYRIVVANASPSSDMVHTVGRVVNRTSDGPTSVIAVHEEGKVDLGMVRASGDAAGDLPPAPPGDDANGDYSSHPIELQACSEGDPLDFVPDHAPGDKWSVRDGDETPPAIAVKPCKVE